MPGNPPGSHPYVMSSLSRYLFHCLLAFGLFGFVLLRAETASVVPLGETRLWERVEFRVDGVPRAANPFDPEQIRLDATITAPSGKRITVPAFWYQEYRRSQIGGKEVLEPTSAPHWRIRFTPTEAGAHSLSLVTQARGATYGEPVVLHFPIVESRNPRLRGWVKVSADARSLENSEGKPIHLSGANVCWDIGGGSYDFDTWFESMHQAGENFARLWMCPWSLGLENKPGNLNNYDQKEAWKLDHVFEQAEEKGLYLMLCFDHHGMYQESNDGNAFWSTNPYGNLQGGPCAKPNDFFTLPAAKTLYQKRLRYLVGRYSYSPALLSWQLQNEVDNVFGALKEADVVAWHREMGAWLRSADPYKHLITTSLKGGSERPAFWTLPEMDISMYHSYEDSAPARRFAALAEAFLQRYGKPVMIGEYGISPAAWNLAGDPYLRGLRQALWGGALGGSVGTAMSWWWESIHTDNAYPLYASLRRVLDKAGLQEGTWTPLAFTTQAEMPAQIGQVLPEGEVFTAILPLAQSWLGKVRGTFAVGNRLGAERASEFLHGYVQGTRNTDMRHPFIVNAHFGEKARFMMRVASVSSTADLRVRIDGQEVFRKAWDQAPSGPRKPLGLDTDFAVEVPAGKHSIEVLNTGEDWVRLDTVTLENVREASFPNSWTFAPEPIGLRKGGKAVVYVTSPWTVYPAGARRSDPAPMTGQTLTLKDWPSGKDVARWFDTRSGLEVATTHATTQDGLLLLPLPPLSDDLAGALSPAE